MFKSKKLLIASAVAAIAFTTLQSFTSATPLFVCVGGTGECVFTLSDGTQVWCTGQIRLVSAPDEPVPALPAQNANRAVAGL